ncbi:MAG: hypothetical protein JWL95_1509 [Gemmatimonadetes bacterium]|nr:hypothetical protein [Gemmatimonadota bacterium]
MLLALTLLSALHIGAPADSVVGAWRINGEVGGTAWTEVCTFAATGAALSGNCIGDAGQPFPLTGELKDGKISFKHGGDYQGQEITILFDGALGTPTELKGTVLVKPFDASGTFTASPVPPKK